MILETIKSFLNLKPEPIDVINIVGIMLAVPLGAIAIYDKLGQRRRQQQDVQPDPKKKRRPRRGIR